MTPTMLAKTKSQNDVIKKELTSIEEKPTTLKEILDRESKETLVGRKFFGHDNDYNRDMIYRVEKYDFNTGVPIIYISELTFHPGLRVCPFISADLHLNDLDVTLLNLSELAETTGLKTEHFHYYV